MNLFGRSKEKKDKDKDTVKETLLDNENAHTNTATSPKKTYLSGFRDKFHQAKTLEKQHQMAEAATGTSKKTQAQAESEIEAQLNQAKLEESLLTLEQRKTSGLLTPKEIKALTPKERKNYEEQQAEQIKDIKYTPPSLD